MRGWTSRNSCGAEPRPFPRPFQRALIFEALGDPTRLELVSRLGDGQSHSIAHLSDGLGLTHHPPGRYQAPSGARIRRYRAFQQGRSRKPLSPRTWAGTPGPVVSGSGIPAMGRRIGKSPGIRRILNESQRTCGNKWSDPGSRKRIRGHCCGETLSSRPPFCEFRRVAIEPPAAISSTE